MPRPPRIKFENAWYHVMNRGAGRKYVFNTDAQKQLFIDLLQEVSERFEVEIHAYCLMGNHFHLLVRTPKASLSDAFQFLSSIYTRRYNKLCGSDGPIFKSRFKTMLIDADSYLVSVSRYIHRNPVEANLVRSPADYVWSSYCAYLGTSPKPVWLHTNEVLRRLGSGDCFEAYRTLVENEKMPTLKALYDTNRLPGVLGSKQFKHYVSSLGFAMTAADERGHTLKRIFAAVVKHSGLPLDSIVTTKKGQRSSSARHIALLLASQKCSSDTKEISREFNLNTAAYSVALSRARRAVFDDRSLTIVFDAICKNL